MEPGTDPHIVIACGGTGGHLYPGLAVAQRLADRDVRVTLMVSPKEVDQRGLRCEQRHRVVTIPAVGFSATRGLRFLVQAWRSYRMARRDFRESRPDVYLSMGGFTSAPPAWAARAAGLGVVFHEANAVPGRANRWLAQFARRGYLFFPEAACWIRRCATEVVGMPVRDQFQPMDPSACRAGLGLAPNRPVLLVMGGSQGATAINRKLLHAAPLLAKRVPGLQFLHLTGSRDEGWVRDGYRAAGLAAVVRSFLTEMEYALGAADAAVTRAGASSIAELAAMRVPALLIPYPHAADDHQVQNARALERTGAAWFLPQQEASTQRLADELTLLLTDASIRRALHRGLGHWHRPDADLALADALMELIRNRKRPAPHPSAAPLPAESPSRP